MRVYSVLVPAALLLAGCTMSFDNPMSSGPTIQTPAELQALMEPISVIDSMEIGTSYRGVVVQATGVAALQGYAMPELQLVNEGTPTADGAIELRFVAVPPENAPVSAGPVRGRTLIAAQFLEQDLLSRAQKVRILARDNQIERPL